MADRSAKVQERIRDELGKNPGASTRELQAAAQSVDASVGELSLRQFNAGYVLPLKRKRSSGGKKSEKAEPARRRGGGRKKAAAPEPKSSAPAPRAAEAPPIGDRERVRATLLQFAKDFSEAESRSEIVGVLSDLDRYIDRIVGKRG